MATATRRWTTAIVVWVCLLLLGVGVAIGLDVLVGGPAEVPPPSDLDTAMAWCARVLLLLAVAWVVIGMLAARTRLVRRPGAAAARASWLASSRPWRARESTLGMLPLDRWLMVIVPGALLVATRAVQTSFAEWEHLVLVLGAWLVFALAARMLLGKRSPWAALAAVGGVVVVRCALALASVAIAGPGAHRALFWGGSFLGGVYVPLAFALFVWAFVATGWALEAQLGIRQATGTVLGGVGAGLAVPAAVLAVVGPENALPTRPGEPGLVPWGGVLDVTAALDIPSPAVWIVVAVGAVLFVVGVLLAQPRRSAR